MIRRTWLVVVAVAVLAVGTHAQRNPGPVAPGDWMTINRDAAATRYSPLTQINTGNVGRLRLAWTYRLGGGGQQVPIVVRGVMYLTSGRRVVALDADTGKEIWSYELPAPPSPPVESPATEAPAPSAGGRRGGGPPAPTASQRGLAYWPGDGRVGPRVLFMSRNQLIALDAATGMPAEGFGTNGMVDVGVPYNGTPSIYRNVAIIGANVGENPVGPPGNPRAFDVVTGRKLWEFQTVPRPGEPFNETWGEGWKDRSGTNMWAFGAPIDVERGIVYLPISGPAYNYWGGDRPGPNVFANSIVAVDAQTGKYRWHFQTVHHDLWDSDMPSAGALFDFGQNGRRTPAIVHVGKTSYVFVLDRVTGRPLIPVEERPVPKGDVPGEWYSPTQPFPVRPRPLSRVSFNKETDLVRPEDTSPEHVAACLAMMEKAGGYFNAGPFTPFLYKADDAPPRSTIQLPGGTGGVNWGGVAIDPTTGYMYANAQNTTLVGWTEKKKPGVTYSFEAVGSNHEYDRASVNGVGPFFTFAAPLSGKYNERGQPIGPTLPCTRPPWSTLVAVDANKGEIVWESVLGLNENLPEGKQLVGSSGSAGPTVTAGGLVFVGATSDRRFRAFDAKTGKELWVTRLEATANANPMTYLGRSGKQYVAVVAAPNVMVYALP
jgi:glucose dehydrogenase